MAVLAGSSLARPGELRGTALVAGSSTDSLGASTDQFEQQYSVNLYQDLTPYVRLRLGFQFRDLRSSFDQATTNRRSEQPQVELTYSRPGLTARVSAFDQTVEDTAQGQRFERRLLAANLGWRPSWGPSVTAGFHDDENLADVSVVGAGVRSRSLDLTAQYGRPSWSAGYSFGWNRLDNPSNDLRSDQHRHEVRGTLTRSAWSNRLWLVGSGRASRVSRTFEAGDATRLAEPLTSIAGLATVDATPELGELDSNPSLVDGDIRTPASPEVDIGGANLFRNVGVDLGVTRSASQIEIAVDTVSDPALVWRVFHSRDNLFWEEIAGASSSFDLALLRYRISFPATQDRFFKAVNVSVNPRPRVLVTEVRALSELSAAELAGRDARDTELFRGDVTLGFRPFQRVEGSVGFGSSNDQALTAGIARRDFEESHAFARLGVELPHDMDLQLGWRSNRSEDRAGRALYRHVEQLSARLGFDPLPTLQTVVTVSHRTESDREDTLQSQAAVRLGVVALLLPGLRLISDVQRSRLDDPFAGRDRITWTWRESLDANPLPTWNVTAGFTYASNRTSDGEGLLDRKQFQVSTTWTPAHYVTLNGSWWVNLDAGQRATSQSYNLSYTPGDRFTLSASYQALDSSQGTGTSTSGVDLGYRLFPRWLLFASASWSRSEGGTGPRSEISSLRTGLRVSF